MAFHTLFMDSFDHYATAQGPWKWQGSWNFAGINSTPGVARTGTGCLECNIDAAGGNCPSITTFGSQPNLIVGFAFQPGVVPTSTICNFLDEGASDYQCFASLSGTGALAIINHYIGQPGPTLLTTDPGLIKQADWNYIELAIIFSTNGSVYARINGGTIYSAVGVNTIHSGNSICSGLALSGPPADDDSASLFDDFYLGYSDDPANISADLQGVRRLYPYIPSANETPLQWTPLSGSNYSEVNQIPPPGDAAYVSSPSVGTTDQYKLAPVSGEGPSGAWSGAFGQTVISARLDSAGSGSVAGDIGGTVASGQALTTSYSMYLQPYDTNPATGEPFASTDFATVFFGPKQTA